MRVRERWSRLTPFQRIMVSLLALCLVAQAAILLLLLDTRARARPLTTRSAALVELADQGPYLRQATVDGLLLLAADQLDALAESRLRYTFHLSQSFPFSTTVAVDERIAVPVNLVIEETIPIQTDIPLQQQVVVPVRLTIDQVVPVDTVIPFNDELTVPVEDVLHIDERFTVRVLGQDISLPIRGDIPISLTLVVPVEAEFPFQAEVPVSFPVSETLPVAVDWLVPVDLEVPVRLPVETTVEVPFERDLPIRVTVPVALDVPLDIALDETPLGGYLRELARRLRELAQDN